MTRSQFINSYSEVDQRFMSRALELARLAEAHGEVPVGAVLVEEGQPLAESFNAPISGNDATAHAEIRVIRSACAAKNNYRLPNTTLYVTLEPCAMCAGALLHARVARVVIATREPRAGAAGSVLNVLQNGRLNHHCRVDIGLFEGESSALLKSFFKSRR